jgi:maltose/moltooligosaccharide transporter
MASIANIPGATNGAASDERFRCGTLLYTKAGLFVLFSWLLWGDFCFTLMESVWPKILPLILRSEGTPNFVISLVITTIPAAMNFVMNPIIGTISDRFRGRRGRRIPFLLVATPFVAVFLALIGFSRSLGELLHRWVANFFPNLSEASVTIGLICILLTSFIFFELFVNTVYWYLFNDVVPAAFMGRFLGLFRVIGSLAGALFNYFLLAYAESHTSTLFFGVAILYGSMFMLMCLNVKEGQYPPPDVMRSREGGWLEYVKVFFAETFSHRIFRLVFLFTGVFAFAGSIGVFSIFMPLSIGLTLDEVGKVAGIAAFVATLLMYPMGSLIDRWHPIRVMLVAQICLCLVTASQLIFLFFDFPKETAFWVYAGIAGIGIPVGVAQSSAMLPMLMRLFPNERFGQFCAANAMSGALATIVGGMLAGVFMDFLKGRYGGSDYCFRFVPAWSALFIGLAAVVTFFILREWKRLGGDRDFQPPSVHPNSSETELPKEA